jgi:TRAP-type C4-dicarboxylate transport system substrate-binding protein/serine/threonine protein kinase
MTTPSRNELELYVMGEHDDPQAIARSLESDEFAREFVASEVNFERLLHAAAAAAAFCPSCHDMVEARRCKSCGTTLRAGGYTVECVLVSSMYGRMYIARDANRGQVALKELAFVQSPTPAAITAFEHEAKSLRSLEHSGIPRFVASFSEGVGVHLRYYLAQEFVNGEPLDVRLVNHWFTEPEIIDITRQVLRVLVYLQSMSPMVIHRDIKPANLLVRADGTIAVVDFGVPQIQSTAVASTTIRASGYMPIDQLAGIVDATTDPYALGASLIHLLTRRDPWLILQGSAFEHITASVALVTFLGKLVKPKACDRFPNAAAALEALECVARSEPTDAVPAPVAKRRRRRCAPLAFAAASLALAGLVAGAHAFLAETPESPESALTDLSPRFAASPLGVASGGTAQRSAPAEACPELTAHSLSSSDSAVGGLRYASIEPYPSQASRRPGGGSGRTVLRRPSANSPSASQAEPFPVVQPQPPPADDSGLQARLDVTASIPESPHIHDITELDNAMSAVVGESIQLRLATLAPEGSNWMTLFEKAAADIKEKTTGRVILRYFPGGSQGDELEYVSKIDAGRLEGAALTSIGLAQIDASIRVLEMPMMFQSEDEVDYVADKMWPYFQQKFERQGFILGDRGEVGWMYLLSQQEVRTLADLRRQRIWQWKGDELVGAMFEKLTLNGVLLSVPEVDSSLSSGRITAVYGSPTGAVALQWFTKIKFMTSMPISFAIGATVISQTSWKKLSAVDQRIVGEISKRYAKSLRDVVRKGNRDATKVMRQRGVVIVQTPDATIDEFTKQAEAMQQGLVDKVYSRDELDMVIRYRNEFRAKQGVK